MKLQNVFITENVKKECTLPITLGYECNETSTQGPEDVLPSYGYNGLSKRCEEFLYEGCGGNDNRFSTRGDCWSACGKVNSYTTIVKWRIMRSRLMSTHVGQHSMLNDKKRHLYIAFLRSSFDSSILSFVDDSLRTLRTPKLVEQCLSNKEAEHQNWNASLFLWNRGLFCSCFRNNIANMSCLI